MAGLLRIPRSRGALSGTLLVLLGIWGGLVPFAGPYFHYAYTPGSAWTYTTGRLWLEILPAVGTLAGGLMVLVSAFRPVAIVGAWLAAVSGAWFVIGGALAALWTNGAVTQETPAGAPLVRTVEQIGFYTGLGVAVVFLAALALGRFSVVTVRDGRIAAGKPLAAGKPAADTTEEVSDDTHATPVV